MYSFRYLLSIAAIVSTLTACNQVATVAGYDTHNLNQQAQKSYMQVVGQAQSKGILDTTSETALRVHRIFNRMKPVAEAANKTGVPFQWEMNVVRENTVNAWAMPGGKMVVYTGIVEKLNLTDDEIAAIVGHEMAHALKEHAKKDAGQKIITGAITSVAGSVVSSYTGVDVSSIAALASNLGVDKPFSRSQESEADKVGLQLMAQSGYNPEYAVSLWDKMNKNNNNNGALSAILSTHPTNNQRIDNIRKLLPSVVPIYQKNKK